MESQVESGAFMGELVLTGDCPTQELPFSIQIIDPAAVRLEFIGDDPSTNLIVQSWGNGWWPEQYNRSGFPFFVHNDGKVPIQLDGISLTAMGMQSGHVLAVANDSASITVGPGQRMPVQLQIDEVDLADSYIGDLSVSVNGSSQPVTTSVTTNIKEGTFKALIWLILGFFSAYLFYLRDRFSGRLEIVGQLKNVRMLIAEVGHPDAKNGLMAESRKIERDLQFKDEETVKASAQQLREKALGIVEAEELADRYVGQLSKSEEDKKIHKELHDRFEEIFRLYLSGDMDGAKAKQQEMSTFWNETLAKKSRSGGRTRSAPSAPGAIVNERDAKTGEEETEEAAPPPLLKKPASPPWYQRLEKYIIGFRRWWQWFINWWLVPITQFVAFLLVVYTGLNAVYMGDLTFGVNGLVDYIKLFLYAMVTNVFSEEVFVKRARTLVTEQSAEAAPAGDAE